MSEPVNPLWRQHCPARREDRCALYSTPQLCTLDRCAFISEEDLPPEIDVMIDGRHRRIRVYRFEWRETSE